MVDYCNYAAPLRAEQVRAVDILKGVNDYV